MIDLERQLEDYGTFHDEEWGPITSEDMLAGFVSTTSSDYRILLSTSRRIWVAVAAAVITILLIGVIPLLVDNQETQPVDTIVPTTLAESAPTTLAESTPTTLGEFVPTPGTWSRIPYDEAVFGEGFEQVMDGVTVGGPGLVAVGQAGFADWRPAVWTSVDGIAWSRVPDNDAVFGAGVMSSVTAGGPGLVAVGTSDQAAVWTSPDGFTWSRVPENEAVFGGGEGVDYTAMNSVTAGGPGLVAVGIDGHPHGENVNPVVWTSPDGITWSRVPYDEAVFGTREGVHWTAMESVTAGGPGLVAVGGDWHGVDGQGGAAVWTSVDGIIWSRAPDNEALFGGGMSSVTAGGPGLVAVGWDAVGAAVWTSVDGFTWSRVPHDEAVFGGAEMSSVTAGGPGLVAVGWDAMGAAVWTSPDGIIWSRVPHNEAVFGTQKPDLPVLEMRSITAGGPGLVAVGANGVHPTAGATKSDAAVWVLVPED